jgi:hypothetical protein
MTENVVDPADFVGEPPAGDVHPGDFMSNDQSDPASVTGSRADTAASGTSDASDASEAGDEA